MNARLGTGHWGYGPRVALLHSSEAGLGVLELFEQSGRNVERATVLLRDLLAEWPDGGPLATELFARDLFAAGIDPMVVIRWKDIFESLEASVDACEHVAHVLEGIAIKRAR